METLPTETAFSKVPEVTLVFWCIKILATTLGETAGDALSMSLNLGYLVSTFIFAAFFIVAVWLQIKARNFRPVLYWVTIVGSTTLGTTMADYATRSLGIGYSGGSSILLVLVVASLVFWKRALGSISVESVRSDKAEMFYWLTITFSQTLGTALGDWTADSAGMGYTGAAVIFSSLLLVTAALYFWTKFSPVLLFWAAFVLTRPLGAVVGDFLDKPLDHGGLALSRFSASATLLVLIAVALVVFRQRPARVAH